MKLNTRDWQRMITLIRAHESWSTHGALSAETGNASWRLGKLPREYHESALRACYTIYSYDTPIAWQEFPSDGLWTTPDVRYSVTTSKHQGTVRTAISLLHNSAY